MTSCVSSHFERKLVITLKKYVFNRKYSTGSNWKSVVGLEIHAQINTDSKLFSGSSTSFGGRANGNVSLFDASIPGTLPVLNKSCVESGVLTALALNCTLNSVSFFDRKHYFYADLPAGYQITQQRKPLAKDGLLEFLVYQPRMHKNPLRKCSKIKQIQLEQDSGKSLHDEELKRSLIDLNRAGIPLMEIVFEPDLEDGEDAAALVKELALILTRLKACSCKMEEGGLRVDANVSVHEPGTPLGIRSEVKNISSYRAVAKAINFEIKRQTEILSSGGIVVNETRTWDAEVGKTLPMRDKEVKQDYRFMPEPNLPPLHVNLSDTETENRNIVNAVSLKRTIPELPNESRNRLVSDYNITMQTAMTIVNEEYLLELFEKICKDNPERSTKRVSNILTIELMTLINNGTVNLEGRIQELSTTVGEIIDLLQSQRVNLVTAKYLLEEVCKGNKLSPSKIMEKEGLEQISDPEELRKLCENSIKNNPKMLADWKKKGDKVVFAFLGDIAKTTNNKANMGLVHNILKEILQKHKT